jgi:uncharacterized protein (TIGR02147 family)
LEGPVAKTTDPSPEKNPTPFYQRFLAEELARRTERNPKYSLRAFAAAIGVDKAALSRILSGSKPLTFRTAAKILKSLDMTPQDVNRFMDSIARDTESRSLSTEDRIELARLAVPRVHEIEDQKFRVIADWYHFAILEMTFLRKFRSDPTWIADQLGIPLAVCKPALERLLSLGLLKMISGRYKKIPTPVTTKDRSKTSDAHRQHQVQMMEKSLQSLKSDPIEIRSHTGLTIPINPEKIPEAKRMIHEFSQELGRFLAAGEKTRVYQLSISLFPLQNARQSEEASRNAN